MWSLTPSRGAWVVRLALLLLTASSAASLQSQAHQDNDHPLPLQQPVPNTGANHRLILKDGTYQEVRTYEIVGDRVRYISIERGGDWEELPVNLVDWDATRKWERDHGNMSDEASPAMREAAELDREEAEERADEKYRMPTIAPGLQLPDEDGVFVMDTFQGMPELVELKPINLLVDAHHRHGSDAQNPLAGQRTHLELDGEHANVHLHVNDPIIYASLDTVDHGDVVTTHAFTVHTDSAQVANGKFGAHSASSRFVILALDERQALRFIGPMNLAADGSVLPGDQVIPAKVEALPGHHWLRITPQKSLTIGEYALVEIRSPNEVGSAVWDFRVAPGMGDNPKAISPLADSSSKN
jgi:hypothetical protein